MAVILIFILNIQNKRRIIKKIIDMKKSVFIAGMLLVLLSSTAFAKEPPAIDIITRVWDYMRGKTSVCQVKMTVHRVEKPVRLPQIQP
nr:hypothetical protein [uncultured Desulfobacter sp.]